MQVTNDLSDSKLSSVLDQQERDEVARAKDILMFYTDNFPEVYILICDKCHTKLAIEYVDLSAPNPNHHQGRQVIAISNKLGSFRQRLDGAMGYKCKCGNNTILADIEDGIVPVAKRLEDGTVFIPPEGMEVHPHHIGMVQQRMAQLDYHPDIRLKGKDTITETFRVRRIK